MKKFLFLIVSIFTINLFAVSFSCAANKKIEAAKKMTIEESMVIEAVKNMEIHIQGRSAQVGHGIETMAGADGKVKWSTFKSEAYVDNVLTLVTFVEATVKGKDENGKQHTAIFTFWLYSKTVPIGGPSYILDGKEKSGRAAHLAIATGEMIPSTQFNEGNYRY